MKAFIISFVVYNKSTGFVKHGPLMKTASNKYEAEGLAIEEIRKTYPIEQGWSSHDVVSLEVPFQVMLQMVNAMLEK